MSFGLSFECFVQFLANSRTRLESDSRRRSAAIFSKDGSVFNSVLPCLNKENAKLRHDEALSSV